MTSTKAHTDRVRRELRAAGVGWFGMLKFGPRYLHNLIHENEHIHAVVYGRYRESEHAPRWEEGMLVATERRVLFVDRKPGYLRADDISYDAVAGVEASRALTFSAVTLFTKLGEFSMSFTKSRCAEIFVRYVEKRRLENLPDGQ